MTQTVTLADREGQPGTVTLDDGQLTGSTYSMRQVAGRELARTGSAEAAFAALAVLNNGYVWALPPGELRETETSSVGGQLLELVAWTHERRVPKGMPGGGKWVRSRRLRPHITAAEARGNSRPVSMDEFQHLAALGNRWIDKAKRDATPTTGLDLQWDKIKADAYREVQKEWGGATIDAHTGVPIRHNADLYALSVKPAHMHTVSVPEMASEAEFGAAMDTAKELFRPALERKAFHLGVFHDDEHHRIDMDPVAIVDSTDLVEQVGAYTRAIGGAYHFKTGDGYWPPHVAEGADMAADETTVHFRGPGEWHSQAVEVQDPEPADEPEPDDE